MVVIGILAAIALPRLRNAIYNAYAADIVGDVHAVQIAYSQFIADGRTRIRNAAWGSPPGDLVPYLPDGFTFSNDIADYRWTRLRAGASPWGEESGMLRVRPKRDLRAVLVPRLAAMANSNTIVKKRNQVRFFLTP
jgi:type II secretory pathway pseudopilin PulG